METSTVAVYGNQNITLLVSDAASISMAAGLIRLMNERIADGDSPFIMLGDLDIGGYIDYALDGIEKAHYY